MSEKIKVLITYRGLSEKHIKQIQEISEKIEVAKATDEESILEAARDVEIIFGRLNKETFLAAKRLKWIHVASAGVDRYMFPELVNSPNGYTSSCSTRWKQNGRGLSQTNLQAKPWGS